MPQIRLLGLILILLVAATAFAPLGNRARAQMPPKEFPGQSGEEIFKGICQGCHMPDAKGAVGAGKYPALAANPNLEAGGYVVSIVLHGQKAMPSFGSNLSDEQVGNVVNYVRSNFGNYYTEPVSAADVKMSR